MRDDVRRAIFARRYHGMENEKIPNMGVLTGDDILEMRRGNEFYKGMETGNVFPRDEVRRAREERSERPKYVENFTGFKVERK